LLTGDVVVDSATGGRVTLFASATATAALTIGDLPQGFLPVVWDLEILEAPTADGVVTRLLEGRGRITPEATK
jgi:expansin (peptidoglycan-binding protein)